MPEKNKSSKECKSLYSHCSAYKWRNLDIKPLTNKHSDAIDQLQSMWPSGCTHIALGMAFGWHVISPNAPFTEGVPYDDDDVLKAIVLLTDGEQTSPGWGEYSHDKYAAEDNLEDICKAIKDQGVMVIAFDLRDRDTKERLQNCATSVAHYFDASSNSDLAAAFDAITGQLVKNLHLSR